MIDLGTLGSPDSVAWSINDLGEVVGHSNISGGDQSHAFVYRDGVMRDLNDLIPPASGWVLRGAQGVNNAGQIVGVGIYEGQWRAFLLTPVVKEGPRGRR